MNRKAFQVYLKTEGTARREATLGTASMMFADTYEGRMLLYNFILQAQALGDLYIEPTEMTEVERIIVFEDCPSDANAYIRGAFIIEWLLYGGRPLG